MLNRDMQVINKIQIKLLEIKTIMTKIQFMITEWDYYHIDIAKEKN